MKSPQKLQFLSKREKMELILWKTQGEISILNLRKDLQNSKKKTTRTPKELPVFIIWRKSKLSIYAPLRIFPNKQKDTFGQNNLWSLLHCKT